MPGPSDGSRASAIEGLYRNAAELARAGDFASARVLHEAAGRLLGLSTEDAVTPVIDLATARKRGRST